MAGGHLSNLPGTARCDIKAASPQKDIFVRGSRLQGVHRRISRKALSFINFAAREINCKIVYYGAGLGGKTTNLQVIYQKTADQQKGKMISLATETERTCSSTFCHLISAQSGGSKRESIFIPCRARFSMTPAVS